MKKPPENSGGWRFETIKGNSAVYSIYSQALQPKLEIFLFFPLRGFDTPLMEYPSTFFILSQATIKSTANVFVGNWRCGFFMV